MARFLTALVVLAALAAGALITWPQYLDFEQTLPFAQLIASRIALAALALAAMVFLGLIALVARPLRGLASGLCIVLALVAVANVGLSFVRGWGSMGGSDATPATAAGDITVLAWNTSGDAVDPELVVQAAAEREASVIVLPETSASYAVAVESAIVAGGGLDYAVHTASLSPGGADASRDTTVLVRQDLGTYTLADADITGSQFPTLTLRSADGSGPTIVGVHLAAPMPLSMDDWRAGLALMETRCGDANTILAGSFNATVDHLGDLGRCQDAASQMRAGAVGTWPASFPALVGASFDRVLAGGDWQTSAFAVLTDFDEVGSDHRPVVSVLARK